VNTACPSWCQPAIGKKRCTGLVAADIGIQLHFC
jgi:hypothetical protein